MDLVDPDNALNLMDPGVPDNVPKLMGPADPGVLIVFQIDHLFHHLKRKQEEKNTKNSGLPKFAPLVHALHSDQFVAFIDHKSSFHSHI